MRFISGVAGAVVLVAICANAQAGGFGGFGGAPQAIGAGAFAPGQGPVGSRGFVGGNFPGHQNVVGLWGYGGYGGGYGGGAGGDNYVVPGGNTTVNSYYHYDARPRDGGFYGGGGVFYGDNGYSRVYYNRPPSYGGDYCPPSDEYRPAQHVYYIGPVHRPSRHRAR